MAHYRLYRIGSDGRIIQGSDLNAEDDMQAVITAKNQAAGSAAELWQGARLVRRLPAAVSLEANKS